MISLAKFEVHRVKGQGEIARRKFESMEKYIDLYIACFNVPFLTEEKYHRSQTFALMVSHQ